MTSWPVPASCAPALPAIKARARMRQDLMDLAFCRSASPKFQPDLRRRTSLLFRSPAARICVFSTHPRLTSSPAHHVPSPRMLPPGFPENLPRGLVALRAAALRHRSEEHTSELQSP